MMMDGLSFIDSLPVPVRIQSALSIHARGPDCAARPRVRRPLWLVRPVCRVPATYPPHADFCDRGYGRFLPGPATPRKTLELSGFPAVALGPTGTHRTSSARSHQLMED